MKILNIIQSRKTTQSLLIILFIILLIPVLVNAQTESINAGINWLLTNQNPDGGFPSTTSTSSGSSVYATALSYIALVSITTDATVLGSDVKGYF